MCASTIGGSLDVRNAIGFVLVGDAGDDPADGLPANTVRGSNACGL